jgi:hypothetical protein
LTYPTGAIQTHAELFEGLGHNSKTIYAVSALGDASYMTEVKLCRGQYNAQVTDWGGQFVLYHSKYGDGVDIRSINDFNVGGRNGYNKHFMFSTKIDALIYLLACMILPIDCYPHDPDWNY